MREAALKSINILLWATEARGQLKPLEKAAASDTKASLSARVPLARAALFAELEAAGQQMALLKGCPGHCSGVTEATAAAVGCALAFEILGSICGLLPPNGWLRARQSFVDLMVSCCENLMCPLVFCAGE